MSDSNTSSPATNGDEYSALVQRARILVERATPPGATIAVISKGDSELIGFEGRDGWHFPRRSDGVYAGHHPTDSAAAVRHLMTLRERGAEFLLLPAPSAWWLHHYSGLEEHLERTGQLAVDDESTGRLYALFEPGKRRVEPSDPTLSWTTAWRPEPAGRSDMLADVDADTLATVRTLIDVSYYEAQSGQSFVDADDALAHYVTTGAAAGLDPTPLFDTSYYLDRYPDAAVTGANPLLHFVAHSVSDKRDPNPYFDTAYYYSQAPRLLAEGRNALAHYVQHGAQGRACNPNPLFGNGFYLASNPAARAPGMTPLAHYLTVGRHQGRLVSPAHRGMADSLARSGRSNLLRGNWKDTRVVIFTFGGATSSSLPALAEEMAARHHVDAVVVSLNAPQRPPDRSRSSKSLALEEYQIACDILRPSAIRMLTMVLLSSGVDLVISEVPDVVATIKSCGVACLFVMPDAARLTPSSLGEAVHLADRVMLANSDQFHDLARRLGHPPWNTSLIQRLPSGVDGEGATRRFLELAERYIVRPSSTVSARNTQGHSRRSVIIPCSDWSVSGVNASLEAMGSELIALGWDVEILFTRDREFVVCSAGGENKLPTLPHRFLDRQHSGVEGMWESLVADVERRAPCIVFLGYDFLANSVAPAFTDDVSVVVWVQSDDGDYYEQAYRLGRYCNAVVTVSETLRRNVRAMNPVIGERTHVIHNSSVWDRDVIGRKHGDPDRLRLVYCGRLVQYQKRILDFVDLAHEFDLLGVPYSITLIGTFVERDEAAGLFPLLARELIADGRIVLTGRMSRSDILATLGDHDFFVLLSEFEGLPLALVEGMARGCVPVVADMESGIPELVTDDDDGLVLHTRDYHKWARVIADTWEDRARYTRLSRRARQRVRNGFTMERVGTQFDLLFTDVLREAREGLFTRPPALHWGADRSPFGDVLPPPSMHRPINIAGLQ